MAFNESYKRWHRPNVVMKSDGGTAKTKQGYYKVQNPDKYVGDPNLVIYRSSWEMAFCKYCDSSPSVVRWSSEPIRVPYYDRTAKLAECQKYGLDPNNPKNWVVKYYNTDYWIELKQADDNIQKMFIEIKPAHKLYKPKPVGEKASIKEKRAYILAAKEYAINEAKFAAMREWAERTGVKFHVFTEETLRNVIGKFWTEISEK